MILYEVRMRGKATIKVTLHNIDIETSLPEDSLNYLNTQGTIPTLCKQLQQSIECIRATHINIKQLVKLKISEHNICNYIYSTRRQKTICEN